MAGTMDDIIDNLQLENAISIDIDEIDKRSVEGSQSIIDSIVAIYNDADWVKAHPHHANRVKIDLETLRGLLKMRHADEQAHDALLQGISSNNGNASLYRALAEIQKTSLAVTTKIGEVINSLSAVLKEFMMESQYADPAGEADNSPTPSTGIHRGSKDFIKQMNADA